METTFTGQIPDSILPYPVGFWNQMKYMFWKMISPGYEGFRNMLIRFRFLHHEGRQNYLIGKIAPGVTMQTFLNYLKGQEFGNHFIAWMDSGQFISLRRLDGFERQYHLRIFRDGEVRGHYEYTPEAHPIMHLQEVAMEQREDDFKRFLGDWVIFPKN